MNLVERQGRLALDLDAISPPLTESQREALRIGTEQLVTAGAGAGKTHTLAVRYVATLVELANEEHADIERVLLVTFTNDAAQEMSDRCHKRLLSVVAFAREHFADHRATARLATMLDRFESALICTYHSLYMRILTWFPDQAGVLASNKTADDATASRIATRALEEALAELEAEEPGTQRKLLEHVRFRSWTPAGRAALNRIDDIHAHLLRFADGTMPWETFVEPLCRAVSPGDAATWLADVGRPTLARIAAICAHAPRTSHLQTIDDILAEARPEATDALATYDAYKRCLMCLAQVEGSAASIRTLSNYSFMGTKGKWSGPKDAYTEAKDLLKGEKNELEGDWLRRAEDARSLPTSADRELHAFLPTVARWWLRAEDIRQQRMREQGVLTFGDMQRRATQMVLSNDDVRQSLLGRFDAVMVDEAQDSDASQWKLVEAISRQVPGQHDQRLFVVGDIKQAIYGFRGSAPDILADAASRWNLTPVELRHNFRSQSALIDWFNAAFETWMPNGSNIVDGREIPGGSVTVITHDEKPTRNAHWPSAVLASLLQQRHLAPGSPYLDLDAYPDPPIALLFRSRTRLAEYEKALRDAGIGYATNKAKGFWERPEILDVLNTMAAVLAPSPQAMVGALRAPHLGLFDQDIQDIVDGKMGAVTLQTFVSGTVDGQANERLRAAQERLQGWAEAARNDPTWRWVDRLGQAVVDALPVEQRPRAMGNVARLVHAASDDATASHHAILERWLGKTGDRPDLQDTSVVTNETRVMLSTVHGAKGLEYPVVFIDATATKSGKSDGIDVGPHPDGQWGVSMPVRLRTSEHVEPTTPGTSYSLRACQKRREQEESLRLLYVAVTRAKEHLIILGHDNNPWMKQMSASWPAATEFVSAEDVLGTEVPPHPASDTSLARTWQTCPSTASHIRVSPSQLDRFSACPARWYLGAIRMVPEHASTLATGTPLGAQRGSLIHDALEDGLDADAPELERRVRQSVEAEHVEQTLETVMSHLQATHRSPGVRAAFAAQGSAEIPFDLRRHGVSLSGRIDRLYKDNANGWVVLDWKSESTQGRDRRQLASTHEEQLKTYAWAASRVLAKQGEPPVRFGEIVFTDSGTVVRLGPWDAEDFQALEQLLERVGQTALEPIDDVIARSITTPRNCQACGYFGTACPGTAKSPG